MQSLFGNYNQSLQQKKVLNYLGTARVFSTKARDLGYRIAEKKKTIEVKQHSCQIMDCTPSLVFQALENARGTFQRDMDVTVATDIWNFNHVCLNIAIIFFNSTHHWSLWNTYVRYYVFYQSLKLW